MAQIIRAILLASVIATSVRVFGQHAPEPRAFFRRIFVHNCTDHRHGPNDEQPSDKTGRGQVSAPIFILVPQVKLRKLKPAASRVPGGLRPVGRKESEAMSQDSLYMRPFGHIFYVFTLVSLFASVRTHLAIYRPCK